MRVGLNPNKDKASDVSQYLHQVIIPVYIPNQEGYFKDSLKIFKLCLESLFVTTHYRTFITIINNGSCKEVTEYLDRLYADNKIMELIQTENIGKLNAILKGLVGNQIEIVTISDADVFFLPNWQYETTKIFNEVPKAGMVGIVPQFKMYEAHCGNVIFNNIFNKKLRFLSVKNPESLKKFYKSIGWKNDYNKDYLKFNLGLKINKNLSVLIGSGHFVSTYKKDVFDEVTSFIGYKLGGISETYLDKAPLKKGYWRLTTQDNYAYHMGNTFENWMKVDNSAQHNQNDLFSSFVTSKRENPFIYFIKNRFFIKFISIPFLNKLFLRWKKLPKEMVKRY